MIGGPHRRSRNGLWFAAFTIISLLLLLASQTQAALTLQRVSARALDPIRQTIGGIGSGIAGVFGTIGEIDRLLMEETGLPVIVADDPLTCVVRGCGKALENMEKLQTIFTSD